MTDPKVVLLIFDLYLNGYPLHTQMRIGVEKAAEEDSDEKV
jgi:hypothetical protein